MQISFPCSSAHNRIHHSFINYHLPNICSAQPLDASPLCFIWPFHEHQFKLNSKVYLFRITLFISQCQRPNRRKTMGKSGTSKRAGSLSLSTSPRNYLRIDTSTYHTTDLLSRCNIITGYHQVNGVAASWVKTNQLQNPE